LSLGSIDPQMVIEAILSREWANRNEKTRWRVGLNELTDKLKALGGNIPFAQLTHSCSDTDSFTPEERYADVAREFYQSVIDGQSNRPGWSLNATRIKAMLDAMSLFTTLRLEMEFSRDIVSSWSILPTKFKDKWGKNQETLNQVKQATRKLISLTRAISEKKIVGEPSNDDPQVSATLNSLKKLLMPERKGEDKQLDEKLDQEIQRCGGPLMDSLLKATELAGTYCDAQRAALFNKLAKAFQKPDFCVRRDSVASPAAQERYFPRSESWNDDWYGNDTSGDS